MQMLAAIGADAAVDMFLTRFRNAFYDVENAVRVFREAAGGETPETLRAQEELPGLLEKVNNYTVMALHLLPLCELGALRRTLLRIQRSVLPTAADKRMRVLIERFIHDESDA